MLEKIDLIIVRQFKNRNSNRFKNFNDYQSLSDIHNNLLFSIQLFNL